MADKQFPLSLVIRAVDKATAPLRAVNKRIQEATAPVRKLGNSLKALAVEAGLPKLYKGIKGVGLAIGNVGSEVAGLGLKLGAMAAGAGFALYGIINGAVDAGDKLVEMAQRVGLSVDAYAQLQYAAAQADVDQEAFNGAMDKFNRKMGEAKAGGGSLLEFLKKVSPALADQIKGAKGTEDALGLMTKAFEKVTDPGKRAALAAAAFGKSGLQMGQFLGQGGKAIEAQRKRYLDLAGSQEEFANNAGELDNAMRDVETSFMGLRNAAAGALFPALVELAGALENILAGNRENLREWARETGAALMEWVKGGGLKQLVADLRSLAGSVKTAVEAVGGLKGVAAIAGLVLSGPLLSSIGGLAQSLWTLGGAALPVATRGFLLMKPVLAAIGPEMLAQLGAFGKVLPLLKGIGAALASGATAAAPFLAAAAGLAAAGYAIYKNWESLKELFTDFTGPGGLLGTLKEMAGDIRGLMPDKWLGTAASWWGKQLGITGGAPTGAATGAAAALPVPAAAGEAHVQVDFANVPRGARVSQDPKSTASVDLSLGYSMGTPD